jgi:Haem-binding domain
MDRTAVTRLARRGALVAGGLLVVLQLVPYGWRHPNPPVVQDAPWPDEASAAIARDSCYDCHSNETDWPLYSYVAPMSWLVRRDVESGRDELNFSRWDEDDGEADDAIEAVLDGSMPPDRYTMAHRGSTLSDDEVDQLIAALEAMDRGGDDSGNGGNGGDRDNSGRGRGGDEDDESG